VKVDNINILRDRFPLVWNHFKENEELCNSSLIQMLASKKGPFTLAVQQEKRPIFLHSQYDPIHEAEVILSQYEDAGRYQHVLFYGVGLGYHIELFTAKFPNISFSIYEPVPEVFESYLSHQELKKLPLKSLEKIQVETCPDDVEKFLQEYVGQIKEEVLVIELPSYKRAFLEKRKHFFTAFKDIVVNRRRGMATDFAFEKRWIVNSMINFKEVLNTPNILIEKKGAFKDKPALLVAAGPSLDDEIENIRYIKDHGLAYIFSVGSAINTLFVHDIYPHAACTYDPTHLNQKVFKKVCSAKIDEIPLIFGSSVGYETLQNYPGAKFHMITSQDTVAQYYLKMNNKEKLDIVYDAPSIAVITLQLLYKLSFNPIILVGQNLAYKDKRHYADGVEYGNNLNLNEKRINDALIVDDVYGNKVYTNLTFNSMRQNMESVITQFPNQKIINTTKGGARIKGTEFVPMEELMGDILQKPLVEPGWAECSTSCDINYLRKQYFRMNEEYADFNQQIDKILEQLKEINKLKEAHHKEQLEKVWPNFDKSFRKLTNNLFYKTYILPMNRVQYALLFKGKNDIQFETDMEKKAQLVIERFGSFIYRCKEDATNIKPIFQKLNEAIAEKIGL